ncbi:uncharacterized protein PGTG_07526 [Puccinia graminis f. sp. tritici CRL 75-36-700-3]|uniref:Secreted protein n=1 Tax=Puccinia graminis f. sp. tritici (strain CRL 75-36-700-3 / race SCCL) TaxID=418459 RepID=E3KDB4_PUCGT|nr:uncharacterized protein PGTG_07526 [Puccinia graminis f. sp. tritici CRL 75-36-700-3]EFP82129.2 hypothetical protein PGTG_07526 [Puccinia graminis f. sp. tritici CRL 75-36-700-3]
MSGLCAIGRYGVVFALLLKSFSVAPGLGGPPPDPSLYTARCQQCWQVAGSPSEFINTMYKTITFNFYPCSAISHDRTCRQTFRLQRYCCVRCWHFVNVSLGGGCPVHGQLTQYIPREPRQALG